MCVCVGGGGGGGGGGAEDVCKKIKIASFISGCGRYLEDRMYRKKDRQRGRDREI